MERNLHSQYHQLHSDDQFEKLHPVYLHNEFKIYVSKSSWSTNANVLPSIRAKSAAADSFEDVDVVGAGIFLAVFCFEDFPDDEEEDELEDEEDDEESRLFFLSLLFLESLSSLRRSLSRLRDLLLLFRLELLDP